MDKRTIKVAVRLTVEVDLDDYLLNYGYDAPREVRADVKDAIADAVASGGVFADGIVGVEVK